MAFRRPEADTCCHRGASRDRAGIGFGFCVAVGSWSYLVVRCTAGRLRALGGESAGRGEAGVLERRAAVFDAPRGAVPPLRIRLHEGQAYPTDAVDRP